MVDFSKFKCAMSMIRFFVLLLFLLVFLCRDSFALVFIVRPDPYDDYYSTSNTKGNSTEKAGKERYKTGLSYYENPGKTGWWWYQVEEKHEQASQPQEKKPDSSVKKEEEKQVYETVNTYQFQTQQPLQTYSATGGNEEIKPLEEYTYEELLYMHPEKFRKIYNYYLEKAVGEPTEKNLFYLFNLQDVLRKKAALFASVYSYVNQKYAQYSVDNVIPVTVPGIQLSRELRLQEVESYVIGKKDDYGLIFFVKSTCPYCAVQENILKPLVMSGITIKKVYIDNRPDIAAKFGIEIVPTIVLVHRKSGEFMTIASGVTAINDIKVNISRALRILEGENPGYYHVYDYQKGTPLDPFEPPPLWRKKK